MPPDGLAALYAQHVRALQAGYAAALAAAGWDAVVIHSGTALKRSVFDDQHWPLRPVPHFQHWLPLREADCALVIVPGARPLLLRLQRADYWEAPPPFDADFVWEHIDQLALREVDRVRAALPAGRVAFVGEDRSRAQRWDLDDAAVNPAALVDALDQLRVTKSAYEIACLAEANRRAAEGHDVLRAAFSAGDASELELHLAYLRATRQDDPETPYKNIIAQGAHAATLHHIAYGRRATASGSLLVDAGATCHGYASDITRTFVRGQGAAVDVFGALLAGVEAMQQALCQSVRVGMPYEALHDACHQRLTGLLRSLGILRGPEDALLAAGLSRVFLPHGLGHSLGLQCHDVGCALTPPRADNPWLRNTANIAVDQVFTVEPGVYFIDPLLQPLRQGPNASLVDWTLVDALMPFGGVRIEDDVHVLAHGIRNLTREVLPD